MADKGKVKVKIKATGSNAKSILKKLGSKVDLGKGMG